MIATSIKYKGHRCFKGEWAGFDKIKPVNVIIGRNNTGKSHVLDLAKALCDGNPYQKGWFCKCTGTLDERTLKGRFPANTEGGVLGGNYWTNHGQHFVGVEVNWTVGDDQRVQELSLPQSFEHKVRDQRVIDARMEYLRAAVQTVQHPLTGLSFRRLTAERDIRPEKEDTNLDLSPNGVNATNIIRRYILSSGLSRDLIQTDLLVALNEVFGPDGNFTEILVRLHDDSANGPQGHYEVFVGQQKKGLVPLSRSGSGLKTVLLVLLNLLVTPKIQNTGTKYVFAFEELENNLHPALLRRLFRYLEDYASLNGATVFLTTHSSVAIDVFGVSDNAQIIHVSHDGESARTVTISAHFDHLAVVSELGAKPSDLLQSNGVVWLEGPSDRIYLNRWIELFGGGAFREGRDYQCAFYGGSLLARTQFVKPEDAEAELVNLLRINPNIVVVCDSDRTAATGSGAEIKDRVRRIRDEIGKIPGGHIWVTASKEIENYVPGSVFGKVFDLGNARDPDQFEQMFPSGDASLSGTSYVETQLKRKGLDKVELAIQAAPHMQKESLSGRFDLPEQIMTVIERIRAWNR